MEDCCNMSRLTRDKIGKRFHDELERGIEDGTTEDVAAKRVLESQLKRSRRTRKTTYTMLTNQAGALRAVGQSVRNLDRRRRYLDLAAKMNAIAANLPVVPDNASEVTRAGFLALIAHFEAVAEECDRLLAHVEKIETG